MKDTLDQQRKQNPALRTAKYLALGMTWIVLFGYALYHTI